MDINNYLGLQKLRKRYCVGVANRCTNACTIASDMWQIFVSASTLCSMASKRKAPAFRKLTDFFS